MRKNHNAPAYHNAFYATQPDDLKYKKDRESSSFDIRFTNYGNDAAIIARSYSTDIAMIDNRRKIAVISRCTYSNTTSGQIAALEMACPPDYLLIRVDAVNSRATDADFDAAKEKARADAIQYFEGREKYRANDWGDWRIHKQNAAALGLTEIYQKARRLEDEQQARADAERQRRQSPEYIAAAGERAQKRADAASRKLEKQRAEWQEKQNVIVAGWDAALKAAGGNIIKARASFRDYDKVDAVFNDTRRPWQIEKRHGFIWDGKDTSAIQTTSGVVFRPADALEFINFEKWEKGAEILKRYTFHGEDPANIFVIGCHNIPRAELELLREMIQGGAK